MSYKTELQSNNVDLQSILDTVNALPEAESTGSGSVPVIRELTITANGTYTASDGVDGYSPIVVNVESSGSQDGSGALTTLIMRTISGEYINNDATIVGGYSFYKCESLTGVEFAVAEELAGYAFYDSGLVSVKFPLLKTIGNYVFQECAKLAEVYMPEVETIGNASFRQCTVLQSIDFPKATSIGSNAFYKCSALNTLIIRSTTLCALSATNSISSTPIESGTGYIYVPSALLSSYQSATNWSTYSAQFRALEDYTVDGTVTGALDETKI